MFFMRWCHSKLLHQRHHIRNAPVVSHLAVDKAPDVDDIKLDSLVKTPRLPGANGRIMWGKGVGAAPGRGRGACSERETRKRASGSPSSW